jgi:hypothetical protein
LDGGPQLDRSTGVRPGPVQFRARETDDERTPQPSEEDDIRYSKRISALAVAAGLAATTAPAVAAPPSSDDASVSICNEAENSHRGGYTVSGGIVDPNPPAFLRGSQMRVGNGHGAGLLNAAQHSPALRECGPTDGGGGGGGNT